MTANAKASRGSRNQWVPVAEMKVNPVAQREFRQAHAEKYAAQFDIDALGIPVLNKRDNNWYIVDGQHRIAALKLIGYSDQSVYCDCFEGLTEQQEADLFLKLNDSLNVTPIDTFRVGTAAERETPTDVDRIVRGAGLRVARGKKDGSIGAVSSLTKVYQVGGPKVLARTLHILRDAYGSSAEAFGSDMIRGVGILCARYNGELDDAAVIDRLAHMQNGVIGLRNKAAVIRHQLGRPVDHCIAAAIVDTMNSGRRGKKLPTWWS